MTPNSLLGADRRVSLPRWRASSIALAWTPPALLAALYSVVTLRMGGSVVTWRLIVTALCSWYTWALVTPLIERIADRWPIQRPPKLYYVLLHLAGGIIATGVQAVSVALLSLFVAMQTDPFSRIFLFWFVTLLPAGVVVYAAVVGVRMAEASHNDALLRTRLAEQLSAELSVARLAALRAQLRPHFLFNTLNAVIALVRARDNDHASEALMMLSDLLRATLRGSSPEIPLEEELAFTKQYLGLERLRFGDRLAVRLHGVEDIGDIVVPPFLLQPFVENAIKHGLKNRREGGRIEITVARDEGQLRLRIADNGAGLRDEPSTARGGSGVANARARLDHLYGAAASVRLHAPRTGPGTVVDIALPLRRAPVPV